MVGPPLRKTLIARVAAAEVVRLGGVAVDSAS
jgi:hypothetical protein